MYVDFFSVFISVVSELKSRQLPDIEVNVLRSISIVLPSKKKVNPRPDTS